MGVGREDMRWGRGREGGLRFSQSWSKNETISRSNLWRLVRAMWTVFSASFSWQRPEILNCFQRQLQLKKTWNSELFSVQASADKDLKFWTVFSASFSWQRPEILNYFQCQLQLTKTWTLWTVFSTSFSWQRPENSELFSAPASANKDLKLVNCFHRQLQLTKTWNLWTVFSASFS